IPQFMVKCLSADKKQVECTQLGLLSHLKSHPSLYPSLFPQFVVECLNATHKKQVACT
ncbi:unnamed protein product, partial [Closterium sp. Naga37s-1]